MANNVTVSVEGFLPEVMRMVQENIDDNKDALEENLTAAANAACRQLVGALHNSGGSSDRGTNSMSGGSGSGSGPSGSYDSGWHVYLHKWRQEKLMRVVANKHHPRMTHLLEFGHVAITEEARAKRKDPRFYGTKGEGEGWVRMKDFGTTTLGDKAIARAYESAAPLAKGGA